jgi:sugar phosphate isomerase/epimerase
MGDYVSMATTGTMPADARWPLGLSMCVFQEAWREHLGLVREAGLTCVEVCATEKRFVGYDRPGEGQDLRRLIERAGLTVWSVHGPWPRGWDGPNLGDEDDNARAECLEATRRALALTRDLGARITVVDQFGGAQDEPQRRAIFERGVASLKRLARDAARLGVTIAVENLSCQLVPSTVPAARRMMERVVALNIHLEVSVSGGRLSGQDMIVRLRKTLPAGSVVPWEVA